MDEGYQNSKVLSNGTWSDRYSATSVLIDYLGYQWLDIDDIFTGETLMVPKIPNEEMLTAGIKYLCEIAPVKTKLEIEEKVMGIYKAMNEALLQDKG